MESSAYPLCVQETCAILECKVPVILNTNTKKLVQKCKYGKMPLILNTKTKGTYNASSYR